MAPAQPAGLEGYEAYFGLQEAPFSLAPDPRFLFASASHSAALEQVASALERREPLLVITGEIGTGKTLLCRTVLQQLRHESFLSVINDPLLGRDDLLKQLLQDFGVIARDRTRLSEVSRPELLQTLNGFLRTLAPKQAHAVVIIDEAQHLQPDVLEQIRLLSQVDDARGTFLQIILVGQTDLERLLSSPELRPLQERVSRQLRLEPLNKDEVQQYITHRLALARVGKPVHQLPGADELAQELAEWAAIDAGVEFTPDAVAAVSRMTHGLPRVINLLCDRSLERAYASRLRVIDAPLIQAAARALGVAEVGTPATVHLIADRIPRGRDHSFWTASRPEPDAPDHVVQRVAEPLPFAFSAASRPAAAPRLTIYLVLAASLAFAAVATWFAVGAARSPEGPAGSLAAAAPSSAPLVFNPRPEPAPPVERPAAPETAAATTGTRASPVFPAPAFIPEVAPPGGDRRDVTQLQDPRFMLSTATPKAGGETFDVVVASFRTDAGATSAASGLVALGLPIHRRVSDGWQQVLCGPFGSRADALAAQQSLARAGVAGTHIVQTGR